LSFPAGILLLARLSGMFLDYPRANHGPPCFGPPKRGRVRRGMVQEKLNGQESEPKQSRAEEAKAGEAEANGRAVGLCWPARAAGGTNAHKEKVRTGRFVADVATGWTESTPLLVREQKLLTEALTKVRKQMRFALLGFDIDNDIVFINETVKTCCDEARLVFTRCRPYRKNDYVRGNRGTAPWSGRRSAITATKVWRWQRPGFGCMRCCCCS
jgi:hypothetical protein